MPRKHVLEGSAKAVLEAETDDAFIEEMYGLIDEY